VRGKDARYLTCKCMNGPFKVYFNPPWNACILDRSPLQKKTAELRQISFGSNGDEDSQATTHSIREENSQSIPCLPWIRDLRV
jgi:hypothetical protein